MTTGTRKGCVYNLLSNETCSRGSFRCDRKHRTPGTSVIAGLLDDVSRLEAENTRLRAVLEQRIEAFEAEMKRIAQIHLRDDNPQTIPALTAFEFVRNLRAALRTPGDTP